MLYRSGNRWHVPLAGHRREGIAAPDPARLRPKTKSCGGRAASPSPAAGPQAHGVRLLSAATRRSQHSSAVGIPVSGPLIGMVFGRPRGAGIEPATVDVKGRCSTQTELSSGAHDRTRTCNLRPGGRRSSHELHAHPVSVVRHPYEALAVPSSRAGIHEALAVDVRSVGNGTRHLRPYAEEGNRQYRFFCFTNRCMLLKYNI